MKVLIDKNKKLRLIQLFGGIGFQAMALERMKIPFEDYRLVEIDKYCIKSYNAIHGTTYKPLDIKNVHFTDLGIVDKDKYQYIMTYSFPCTSLSLAGKQEGMNKASGTASSLLWEVERILSESIRELCLPDILIMENVTQVHNKKNIDNFNQWLNCLQSFGYKSKWQDINAKNYGVPQSRNRCFCVSWLDKETNFRFPKSIELSYCMEDCLLSEEEIEDKYYINNERADILIEQIIDKYGNKLVDYV